MWRTGYRSAKGKNGYLSARTASPIAKNRSFTDTEALGKAIGISQLLTVTSALSLCVWKATIKALQPLSVLQKG